MVLAHMATGQDISELMNEEISYISRFAHAYAMILSKSSGGLKKTLQELKDQDNAIELIDGIPAAVLGNYEE